MDSDAKLGTAHEDVAQIRDSLTLVTLLAATSVASAQPTYEKGKVDDVKDVKDVEWTAKGEAGLLVSTGNSKTTTISASANATRKDKDNKFDAAFVAAFARATTRTATDANGDGGIDESELSTTTATSSKTQVEGPPAGGPGAGIPDPVLLDEPGLVWRSRLSSGGWHVNVGHTDYRALATDARARLRYMVALFAKDVTVATTHAANEPLLDQMIDVLAHAERNLLRAPR